MLSSAIFIILATHYYTNARDQKFFKWKLITKWNRKWFKRTYRVLKTGDHRVKLFGKKLESVPRFVFAMPVLVLLPFEVFLTKNIINLFIIF